MPIHDQGYRRYAGRRVVQGRAWWVIARAGVRERLRERRFLALLLLAWMPFLIRAIQIYASTNFEQLSFLLPDTATFREFVDQQSLFLFFITIYAGSGLVADDRRVNALQVYLSRPLTRFEYVLGKFLILAIFLAVASWVPAMALLILQMILAGSPALALDNPWLVPAISLFCATEILIASLAMLALSSLSKSRRLAAVMYAALVFFTAGLYQVMGVITGSTGLAWFSPEEVFDALADALFGMSGAHVLSFPVVILAIASVLTASVVILERRIRPVDVVA